MIWWGIIAAGFGTWRIGQRIANRLFLALLKKWMPRLCRGLLVGKSGGCGDRREAGGVRLGGGWGGRRRAGHDHGQAEPSDQLEERTVMYHNCDWLHRRRTSCTLWCYACLCNPHWIFHLLFPPFCPPIIAKPHRNAPQEYFLLYFKLKFCQVRRV